MLLVITLSPGKLHLKFVSQANHAAAAIGHRISTTGESARTTASRARQPPHAAPLHRPLVAAHFCIATVNRRRPAARPHLCIDCSFATHLSPLQFSSSTDKSSSSTFAREKEIAATIQRRRQQQVSHQWFSAIHKLNELLILPSSSAPFSVLLQHMKSVVFASSLGIWNSPRS
ncbi:hypothetical protein MANES_11G012050v8 [Manihot esculenta]|uniref:Uncharacterized protein n=1 Tax=Manihot esculenta TaxID=3983 RepID=A0ACB7GS18_MANES|nr:hypothetical protein MANES_11G012050v8 [Manihot esculenta]